MPRPRPETRGDFVAALDLDCIHYGKHERHRRTHRRGFPSPMEPRSRSVGGRQDRGKTLPQRLGDAASFTPLPNNGLLGSYRQKDRNFRIAGNTLATSRVTSHRLDHECSSFARRKRQLSVCRVNGKAGARCRKLRFSHSARVVAAGVVLSCSNRPSTPNAAKLAPV